jgi:hypothetical protein
VRRGRSLSELDDHYRGPAPAWRVVLAGVSTTVFPILLYYFVYISHVYTTVHALDYIHYFLLLLGAGSLQGLDGIKVNPSPSRLALDRFGLCDWSLCLRPSHLDQVAFTLTWW